MDYQAAPVRAKKFYFRSGITYGLIASTGFSARDIEGGFVFDVGGSMLFPPEDKKKYILGFLNTNVAQEYLKAINPTLNYQVGDIGKLPLIWNEQKAQIVAEIVDECISLCKSDWDDYETSWDFSVNPIVKQGEPFIKSAVNKWMNECEKRIDKLKTNEENLNSLFADIYGVSKDISLVVDDDRISIKKPSVSECVRLLVMYAVGCMFGRYSLDKQGIVFAGGQWNVSEYKSFIPDKDGIIPICDDEYFEDDIVGRFVAFIENAFGKESLEENRFNHKSYGMTGSGHNPFD